MSVARELGRRRQPRGSERFQADVAGFDLHRGGRFVQLNADFAVHFAVGFVVVNNDALYAAVEDMNQRISARDDMQVVPGVLLD
jgi:hypothetical protein